MLTKQEIKTSSIETLQKELNAARKEHHKLKMGLVTKQMKNSHEAEIQKIYIARILTQMNELKKSNPTTTKKEEEKAQTK